MSKKIRIFVSLLMAVAFCIPFTLNVYAANTETEVTNIGIGIDGAESDIKLYAGNLPCPSSPTGLHGMQGRGMGNAYYGSYGSGDLRIQGTASQCIYCYLVMITENNPFQTSQPPFGNYALWSTWDPISSGVVNVWTTTFGYSGKNSTFSKGFQFIRGFKI